MPTKLILALLFLLFAALFAVYHHYLPLLDPQAENSRSWADRVSDRRSGRQATAVLAWSFTALFVLFVVLSCVRTVSTKNVGVKTVFGRTSGELSNGLHVTWPWVKVTEMDAAIQTDTFEGNNCINVRIANQQTACVPISIRWKIEPSQSDALYQDYHTFDNVRDSLVTRELTAAINAQVANYNPLNSIDVNGTGNAPANGAGNPTNAQIAAGVTTQMRREIGNQIDVINTIIPRIQYDNETQSRINQLQQQIALTRIADQEKFTNEAQATANRALATSVNTSPNVLVAQCLTILNNMVKNGQSVPAGFSCWPGGGVDGVIADATTPVVVPSSK